MTVSSDVSRWTGTGDGTTIAVPYTTKIFAKTDLLVYVAGTLKTVDTHYSVSGVGGANGGNVTFLVGHEPAIGASIVIEKSIPYTQGSSLPLGGPFPSATVETMVDRQTMLTQQVNKKVARTLRQPPSDAVDITAFPVKATRATRILGFDSNGDPTVSTKTLAQIESEADNAAASAAAAASSASSAASSASSASSSASTASTQATNASNSASSASTSATNASNSAAAAATSATDAASSAGALGFRWNFDSSTSMADPGSGDIRLNHATLSSVTAIALSDTTIDSGNPDVSAWVLTWDDSSMSSQRGTLILRKIGTPSSFAIFLVSGASTDNSGWTQLAVSHSASSGSFSNNDDLMVDFTRTGDSGSLDIAGLTEETTVDAANDFLPMYDASAGANRKIKPGTIGFPSGTGMLFVQTAAPTGWTKQTGTDNAAIRLVSGSVADGGTANFTTAFDSRTPAGSVTVDNFTLDTTRIPAHTHTGMQRFVEAAVLACTTVWGGTSSTTTGSTGGGAAHNHTGSFSGTAMDFDVKHKDVIHATKD